MKTTIILILSLTSALAETIPPIPTNYPSSDYLVAFGKKWTTYSNWWNHTAIPWSLSTNIYAIETPALKSANLSEANTFSAITAIFPNHYDGDGIPRNHILSFFYLWDGYDTPVNFSLNMTNGGQIASILPSDTFNWSYTNILVPGFPGSTIQLDFVFGRYLSSGPQKRAYLGSIQWEPTNTMTLTTNVAFQHYINPERTVLTCVWDIYQIPVDTILTTWDITKAWQDWETADPYEYAMFYQNRWILYRYNIDKSTNAFFWVHRFW